MRYVINYTGNDQSLHAELRAISESIEELNLMQVPVWNEEPPKPRQGQLAYADGTNWNPGAGGAGVYVFTGSAWSKL